MRKSVLALVACAGMAVALPASAAQIMFDFSGPDLIKPGVSISGSGVFTTSDTVTVVGGRNAYAITEITGTVDGNTIVAPTGFYGNYFFEGPVFLDGSGVRFNTDKVNNISFFAQSTNNRYRVNSIGSGKTAFVTANFSVMPSGAVPEPATWAMMIVGFGLAGSAVRGQRRKLAFANA